MILSMTGYGSSENIVSNYDIKVEIKSLNSRYLELVPKIHELIYEYENDINALIRKVCLRGKIYFNISLNELKDTSNSIKINDDRLSNYLKEIDLLKKRMNLKDEVSIDYFLKLPDIFEFKKSKNIPSRKKILNCVNEALIDFNNFRIKEGKVIEKDILSKIKIVNKEIKKIVRLSSVNSKEELIRMKSKIENIVLNADISEDRLYQEVAIILEKKDINEELSRLEGHMKLIEEYVFNNENIGKKANFLLQEINREINTVGSKVDNLDIRHIVVNIKNHVEQIREQVQNIL